jgi:CheY-like chemotaxis protein
MAKKRILVVDDELNILKAIKVRLEHEGYDVVTSVDGPQALQQAGALCPHLILLDVKLPGLDGYEVCRTLKRQPATAAIPVIVFSASDRHLSQLADRCVEAGADGWLKKPFRTEELLDKIHRALREEGQGADG